MAKKYGADIKPYYVKGKFQAEFELQVLYHYRVRSDSLEHAKGQERAARYAQAVPALMTSFDAWAQGEPVMEDAALWR